MGYDPRNLWTPQYGLTRFSDLFTNRQLVALTTFSDLVGEAREGVKDDGGSEAYADAVATYLALVVSRLTDYQSSITTWASNLRWKSFETCFLGRRFQCLGTSRKAIPLLPARVVLRR